MRRGQAQARCGRGSAVRQQGDAGGEQGAGDDAAVPPAPGAWPRRQSRSRRPTTTRSPRNRTLRQAARMIMAEGGNIHAKIMKLLDDYGLGFLEAGQEWGRRWPRACALRSRKSRRQPTTSPRPSRTGRSPAHRQRRGRCAPFDMFEAGLKLGLDWAAGMANAVDETYWRDLLAKARGAEGIPGVGDIAFGGVPRSRAASSWASRRPGPTPRYGTRRRAWPRTWASWTSSCRPWARAPSAPTPACSRR